MAEMWCCVTLEHKPHKVCSDTVAACTTAGASRWVCDIQHAMQELGISGAKGGNVAPYACVLPEMRRQLRI